MELTLRLIKKKQEAVDTYSFIFKSEEDFSWKAGQYLVYKLGHSNPDGRGDKRYFTIAAAPFENVTRVTTRFLKEGSSSFKKALLSLPIGSKITAVGPSGGFVVEDPTKDYVFIAGGIGITPYRAILLDLDHRKQPINVTLLYANKSDDIVYRAELDKLASKHQNFKIHYLISPALLDKVAIKKFVPDLANPLFYISGPEPMVRSFEQLLQEVSVPKENIRRDFFPGYERP